MSTDTHAAPLQPSALEASGPVSGPAETRRTAGPTRLLAALAPLAYLCALGAWVGMDNLTARLANDDQSYYILVARNLFERGPTYDGLYLTNGVHPLLAAVLGAIYHALSIPFEQLAAISVVSCVLFGAGAVYVLLGARPASTSAGAGVVATLGSVAVYPVLYRGMEGGLALLCVALYLDAVTRGRRGLWYCALLCSALWAARLELMALPPIAIALATSAVPLAPSERSRLLTAWFVSLAGFGLYALANYCFIGLALPVSGLIKQSSTALLPTFIALGAACGAFAVAPLVIRRLRPLARRAYRTHVLVSFAALFYLVHGWGQADVERQTWYYFLLPGLLACAWLELGDELAGGLRRAALGAICCAALAATVWEAGYVIPLRGQAWTALRAVAERAKQQAEPGERFMGPGWMSLLVGPEFEPFSQDGLVGGVEQFRALRAGRALEFAYDSGVRYVFTSSNTPGQPAPAVPAPYRLAPISSGAVPNGRSLWAALTAPEDPCGLRPCASSVSIFRLTRDADAPGSALRSAAR